MKAIVNSVLVLGDHLIEDGIIVIEGTKITDYGSLANVKIPENCEIIDADGRYIGPGLIDIHTCRWGLLVL